MDKLRVLQTLQISAVAIIALIAVVLLIVIAKRRPNFQKKPIAVYAIVLVLFVVLFEFFGKLFDWRPMTVFLCIQMFSLFAGILHYAFMHKWFKWVKNDGFWPELLFSISVVLFMAVGSMSFVLFQADPAFLMYYPLALLPFLIPFLVVKSFDALWLVPSKKYKLWYYPFGVDVPNPLDYEMSDHMKVIAFEFALYEGAKELNIRVKAPERMELGHYFMSFIEQYNLRNPEQEIQLNDASGMACGWLFSLKTPWYKSAVVFNAETTINDNDIRENDVIVVERFNYQN